MAGLGVDAVTAEEREDLTGKRRVGVGGEKWNAGLTRMG